jgi:adenylate cyclase
MKLGLRAKWTLALVLAGAGPLVLAAGAALRFQRRGLLDAERALAVSVIDHTGDAIESALGSAVDAADRMALVLGDSRIQEDARLAVARETFDRAAVLESAAVYGLDGRFLDAFHRKGARARPDPTAVPPSFEPPATVADGAPQWLPVLHGQGLTWLRYAAPLRAGDRTTGFLVAVLDPARLAATLASISTNRFARPNRILIVDGQARVLLAAVGSAEVPGTSLAGRDAFRSLRIPDEGAGPNVAATSEFTADDGTPMVGTLRVLPANGWAVVVRRPESEAFATLAETRRSLLLAAVLVSLLSVGAGLYLGTRSTRPIARLVELVGRYQKRDFAARSTVRTGDEVQVLGEALGKMADDLAAGEQEIARRATVEANLSRYLPAAVAGAIAAGESSVALGGQRRQISVLFADVASFTTYAEKAPPERVVSLLNQLFSVLSEVVFRHGGTVDKFIGDCIMAIFGAPAAQDDHAARALATAEDMHRFVEANGPAWEAEFGVSVRLAIGVASGDALVGNLGSEARMDYTAIGDVVNVAARLEVVARAGQTLLTADTAAAAGKRFTFGSLGQHALRGRTQPVETLELL